MLERVHEILLQHRVVALDAAHQEVGGVVREVCVDDSSPIEYGQVLFRVDPNG